MRCGAGTVRDGDLLFGTVRAVLFELLEDARYLGARPPSSRRRTPGRLLSLHPHLTC